MIGRFAKAAVVAVGLVGCSAVPAPVTNAVGSVLLNTLADSFFPQINRAIAKDVSASQADLNMIGYWLPWGQAAVDVVGPEIGVSPTVIAGIDAGVKALLPDLTNPPANIGALMIQAQALVTQIQTALKPALPASVAMRLRAPPPL